MTRVKTEEYGTCMPGPTEILNYKITNIQDLSMQERKQPIFSRQREVINIRNTRRLEGRNEEVQDDHVFSSSPFFLFLRFIFFSRACARRGNPKRPRLLGRKLTIKNAHHVAGHLTIENHGLLVPNKFPLLTGFARSDQTPRKAEQTLPRGELGKRSRKRRHSEGVDGCHKVEKWGPTVAPEPTHSAGRRRRL